MEGVLPVAGGALPERAFPQRGLTRPAEARIRWS
jgi:hypothetical protein